MISLKKYLESDEPILTPEPEPVENKLQVATTVAYASALREMGSCSVEACPAVGGLLKERLNSVAEKLRDKVRAEEVEETQNQVRTELREWGRQTARHAKQTTGEVKSLLLVLARTAESVGARDQRSVGQIGEVSRRLEGIATLDNLGEIRASIERSAAELKTSVERMKAESREVIDQLKAEVTVYQTRLEKAEEVASRDVLTGLRSRSFALDQIDRRIESGTRFCLAILDVNDFKRVNDEHGHVVGDELLKQFANELRSACRATDVIGRWGGDEFILLLDCGEGEAANQMSRVRKWVFGKYSVDGRGGPMKVKVDASIGLAEFRPGETLKKLLERADAAMYQDKAVNHALEAGSR